MPPIREYEKWDIRASDFDTELDPLRKYVFICEGESTEVNYIRALIDEYQALELHPLVDIRLWEKTGDDAGLSDPEALIRFAHEEKSNASLNYAVGHDRMVIVFDLDVYCRVGEGRLGEGVRSKRFEQMLGLLADDDILAVTNPSFELFLMLHKKDAYKNIVMPHARELLENRKTGKRRYAQRLFTDEFGMNPKSNPHVGDLVRLLDLAIHEERHLNQGIDACLEKLTCNVGKVIDDIRSDRLEL